MFSFLDLTTINIYSQVGLITLVGLIAKNGILIVQFANTLQEAGAGEAGRAPRGVAHPAAAGADDVGGDRVRAPPAGASSPVPGREARNSIGTVLVTGMIVGTLFTLFVVPVFYLLIAAEHRSPRSRRMRSRRMRWRQSCRTD